MRYKSLNNLAGVILLILAAGLPLDAYARQVSTNEVRTIAEQWIRQSQVFSVARYENPSLNITIRSIKAASVSGMAAAEFWHVALQPRGYMIIAGDDRINPVIAFSLTCNLNLVKSKDNAFRALLEKDMKTSYQVLKALDLRANSPAMTGIAPAAVQDNVNEWKTLIQNYSNQFMPLYTPTQILVSPMITNIWSQWQNYNYLCPTVTNGTPMGGYDNKVPVGCVSVCGAQVANYNRWPVYGYGGHTDSDANGLSQGSYTRIYTNIYNYSIMRTNYRAYVSEPITQVMAIATLIYDIGVGIDMDYEPDGSSAAVPDLGTFMNSSLFYTFADNMARAADTNAFDAALRKEILARRPTVVGVPGHAFMCDGLSSDANTNYFHFSYGWGGTDDGWYRPSMMASAASIDEALIGLQPKLMALPNSLATVTNLTGSYSLSWYLPPKRTSEVVNVRIQEGLLTVTNFSDTGTNLAGWVQSGAPWKLATDATYGSCYFKSNEVDGTLQFDGYFVPSSTGALSFVHKVQLYQDDFYVEISTNEGSSWQALVYESNYAAGYNNPWWSTNISLSAYSGKPCQLRFRYDNDGSWWSGNYGVWLDNIRITNSQFITWSTLTSSVPGSSTNYSLSDKHNGNWLYRYQVSNGTNWNEYSPIAKVVCAADSDQDGDGIANGWEFKYFGSITAGSATNDNDGDGYNNYKEYISDTDPTSKLSRFCIADSVLGNTSTNKTVLAWSSSTGRLYSIWYNVNITNTWSAIASNIAATPPMNVWTDSVPRAATNQFYKINVGMP